MECEKKFKLSTFFFMIKCILRASPILFPLMVIVNIISIGITAYALFVLKDATNGIVCMLKLEKTFNQVMYIVLLYLFIEIVLKQVLQFVMAITQRFYYKQADRYFRNLLLYKFGKLPQVNMYDSDMYNKFKYTYDHMYVFQQLPWHLVSFLINFSFSKLLYLGIIFTFNPIVGLYCALLFIVNIITSIFVTNKQAQVDREQVIPIRNKDYYHSLLSTKKHIKETKINRLEAYFFKKFKYLYLSIRDEYFKVRIKDSLINQIIFFLNWIFNKGLIFILLYMVYKDHINIGEMALIQAAGITLIYAAGQFKRPTKFIVDFVKKSPVMIEMFYPLTKEEIKEMKEKSYPNFKLKLGKFESLVLDNVCYRYPSREDEAVNGINITIKRGEIISILGYNGSGKTTTCKLMSGILTPTEGKVYFNNKDIEEFDKKEYYKYFGIGFQDFTKYSLSLKDNIGFGRIEDYDNMDMVESAIQKTNLSNIINKLPNGIDTYLGKAYDKQGQDLSGGQWQRVILARAYMGSPEILILDEPTASIDSFEEERMLEEFRIVLENKTAILISHRISFARLADKIVMMKNGKIIETGSHEELVEKKGYYYELFSSQQELYKNEVSEDEK